MKPFERLKDLRRRLGITIRDVENHSRKIAEAEKNAEYLVSKAWLNHVERTPQCLPSIYMLYTLSVIYRVKYTDLLSLYGINLDRMTEHRTLVPMFRTHLTEIAVYDDERPAFPVRFDAEFSVERTSLVAKLVKAWGEVPVALIQRLDLRNSIYGYVGLKDFSLYPLLKPGSFVQIDDRCRKILNTNWSIELERPIYFVKLRDGYACTWCELQGKNKLLLVPHPLSGCPVRACNYPDEAEIVGRVTAVAMRIVAPDEVSTAQDLGR